jgi:peptidylamidoglycolate lyase
MNPLRLLALPLFALLCVCSPEAEDVGTFGAPPPASEYELVEEWPALPPEIELGEAVGVGVDSHHHVLVLHRADADFSNTQIIEKDTIVTIDGETGQVVSTWGAGLFVVPHGLSIDRDDNVWITDVGQNKVFKFSHDGELLLTVGAE